MNLAGDRCKEHSLLESPHTKHSVIVVLLSVVVAKERVKAPKRWRAVPVAETKMPPVIVVSCGKNSTKKKIKHDNPHQVEAVGRVSVCWWGKNVLLG